MYAKVIPTAAIPSNPSGRSLQDPPLDDARPRAENAADDGSAQEASLRLALTALTLVALVVLTIVAVEFVSHDRGPFLYGRGSVREGGRKKVESHGRGQMKYASRHVYEDEYQNDKKHGRSIYTSADGDVCDDERNIIERQGAVEGSATGQVNGIAQLQLLKTSKNVVDNAGPGNETAASDDGSTLKAGVVEEPKGGAAPSMAGSDDGVAAASHPSLGPRSKADKDVDGQGDEEEATSSERVVGIIKFADGGVYIGEVLDGKMHRKGVYRWANGDSCEGELDNGEMHGNGEYTWANGNVYAGEWQEGKRHGSGMYTWADGDVYKGDWKDGKKHGKGVYRLANGVEHQGKFVYNTWHPDGKFTEGVCFVGLMSLLAAIFLSALYLRK